MDYFEGMGYVNRMPSPSPDERKVITTKNAIEQIAIDYVSRCKTEIPEYKDIPKIKNYLIKLVIDNLPEKFKKGDHVVLTDNVWAHSGLMTFQTSLGIRSVTHTRIRYCINKLDEYLQNYHPIQKTTEIKDQPFSYYVTDGTDLEKLKRVIIELYTNKCTKTNDIGILCNALFLSNLIRFDHGHQASPFLRSLFRDVLGKELDQSKLSSYLKVFKVRSLLDGSVKQEWDKKEAASYFDLRPFIFELRKAFDK